jgi:hypothetical protein
MVDPQILRKAADFLFTEAGNHQEFIDMAQMFNPILPKPLDISGARRARKALLTIGYKFRNIANQLIRTKDNAVGVSIVENVFATEITAAKGILESANA